MGCGVERGGVSDGQGPCAKSARAQDTVDLQCHLCTHTSGKPVVAEQRQPQQRARLQPWVPLPKVNRKHQNLQTETIIKEPRSYHRELSPSYWPVAALSTNGFRPLGLTFRRGIACEERSSRDSPVARTGACPTEPYP